MSQVTMHKCEHCANTVEDKHAYKGWIEIDLRKVSQQGGRNELGSATTLFYKSLTCERENLMDFCSRDCLLNWFGSNLKTAGRVVGKAGGR